MFRSSVHSASFSGKFVLAWMRELCHGCAVDECTIGALFAEKVLKGEPISLKEIQQASVYAGRKNNDQCHLGGLVGWIPSERNAVFTLRHRSGTWGPGRLRLEASEGPKGHHCLVEWWAGPAYEDGRLLRKAKPILRLRLFGASKEVCSRRAAAASDWREANRLRQEWRRARLEILEPELIRQKPERLFMLGAVLRGLGDLADWGLTDREKLGRDWLKASLSLIWAGERFNRASDPEPATEEEFAELSRELFWAKAQERELFKQLSTLAWVEESPEIPSVR